MPGSTLRVIAAFIVMFICFVIIVRRRSKDGSTATQLDAADCIEYGASLIADGYMYFPDWKTMMLREFDNGVKADIEHYYEVAKLVSEKPRNLWRATIQQQLATNQPEHRII